ncbi:MAG: T9SS type A sorting domain-containing protein [Bacteroidales bacterium]|nr:T9SS type A sorting domain-containing protein [Bacteroidales bacterium]
MEINENTLTANASSAEYQWLDCDNDYGELQGETEQTFSPSINGNYAVRITQNGCVDVSNCHHITTITSINEVETVNYINIYPNPTNGRLIIENEQLKIGKVIIYDMNGKKLSTFNYPLSIAEIDLSDYANGIYFIEVNKTTHKIIKK